MAAAVELRGIVKHFADVVANDGVDLAVGAGEIRAVVGENGAGKTTLMRVLFGLTRPDAGTIHRSGRRVDFASPREAIASGLGMVHQHFMLFEQLTVAENVVFGAEPHRFGLFDRRRAESETAELGERFGLPVDPRAELRRLPVGERQRVEILKALYREAEILILDEPTAVLTPRERDRLFEVLRQLATNGRSILFITHKLEEVLQLSDSTTVMRRGRVVATLETAATTAPELARLMVGEGGVDSGVGPRRNGRDRVSTGEVALAVRDLRIPGAWGKPGAVSFELERGEILGVAGAAGSGQEPLVSAVAGLMPVSRGRILLEGRDVTTRPVAERRALGLAWVPEDRDATGLAAAASIAENLALGSHRSSPLARRGLLQPAALEDWARQLMAAFDVRAASPRQPAGHLSGGNRQRVVVARELGHRTASQDARVLLACQPTRGVDLAASRAIWHHLRDFRDLGGAVLLVTSDLDELLDLSDRLLVLFEGRVAGLLERREATEERLGMLMAGMPGAEVAG